MRIFVPSPPSLPGVRRRPARGRLTLIECLVVTVIAALLMTLLLPSLGSSLQSAKAAHCLGNLKQLGYACLQYSADSRDFLPLGVRSQTTLQHGGTNWARYLMPYLDGTRTLDCPASPDPAPARDVRALHLYDGNYGWNFDGTQGKNGPWPPRIGLPSQGYLLFDSGDQCITYWSNKWESLLEELDLDWDSRKEGCNRHRGQVNIVFLDSHAASRPLERFLAAPNPADTAPWYIKWSGGALVPKAIPFPRR